MTGTGTCAGERDWFPATAEHFGGGGGGASPKDHAGRTGLDPGIAGCRLQTVKSGITSSYDCCFFNHNTRVVVGWSVLKYFLNLKFKLKTKS
jgi:hypothetical protein